MPRLRLAGALQKDEDSTSDAEPWPVTAPQPNQMITNVRFETAQLEKGAAGPRQNLPLMSY